MTEVMEAQVRKASLLTSRSKSLRQNQGG